MSQFIERRCRECGTGTIRPVARVGRKARYKTLTLEVPASLEIPTCNACSTEWLDRAAARRIDAALADVYQAVLRRHARNLITTISDHTPMRQVERLIGLSEGYLSKVRNGRSEPSAELVASLHLLSTNVGSGIKSLDRLWTDTGKDALMSRKHGKREAR